MFVLVTTLTVLSSSNLGSNTANNSFLTTSNFLWMFMFEGDHGLVNSNSIIHGRGSVCKF